MTLFGDKEVIKFKWGHNGGALIWQDWCPYKKRKKHWDESTQKKAICKPRRDLLPETNHDGILILDF